MGLMLFLVGFPESHGYRTMIGSVTIDNSTEKVNKMPNNIYEEIYEIPFSFCDYQ